MAKATYKDAGVDLDIYRQSMGRIAGWLKRTHTPRVIPAEGGFAGLFALDFDNPLFARHYQEPLLVACTDGVGTKLKVAVAAGRHDTVGIDLVAMCVNDAICTGAEPLFFLDYIAMPKDDPEQLEQLVRGIAAGCTESDCALLGGETAILPDMYAADDYDMAGFCVAVVERKRLIDGKQIAEGDQVIGLASSGIHSNGYSLVRKVVFEIGGFAVDDEVAEIGSTVGDALLAPTQIYAGPLRKVFNHYRVKQPVHGIAHITGGGIQENLARSLPENIRVVIDRSSWKVPPLFGWLQKLGEIDDAEMEKVFNLGLGMILVVSPYYSESIRHQLADCGIQNWLIGEAVAGPGDVVWK